MATNLLRATTLLLLLTACATSTQARNRSGMNRLQLGMSRDDVQKELGPAERSESLLQDSKELMVWWYTTGHFSEEPVVFEDGKVTGWGPAAKSKLPAKKPAG